MPVFASVSLRRRRGQGWFSVQGVQGGGERKTPSAGGESPCQPGVKTPVILSRVWVWFRFRVEGLLFRVHSGLGLAAA